LWYNMICRRKIRRDVRASAARNFLWTYVIFCFLETFFFSFAEPAEDFQNNESHYLAQIRRENACGRLTTYNNIIFYPRMIYYVRTIYIFFFTSDYRRVLLYYCQGTRSVCSGGCYNVIFGKETKNVYKTRIILIESREKLRARILGTTTYGRIALYYYFLLS